MNIFPRPVLALCIVLLGVFLLYTSISFLHPIHMSDTKHRAQVIPTQHQDLSIATGTIEARDDVSLAFEDGGVVREVNYDAGDIVFAGSVIASLGFDTLAAQVKEQRSRLEREQIRLNSVITGPEHPERTRVKANTAVSEQTLENKARIALVSAQHTASLFENMVRTELDTLFGGTPDDPYFEPDVPVVTKQRINKMRQDAEAVFIRWRVWSGNNISDYRQVLAILEQFDTDLRFLHGGVVTMYDALLPLRSARSEYHEAFLLLAKTRTALLEFVVSMTKHAADIEHARAQYDLALAQSAELLNGGTDADQRAQAAQVGAEEEKLRQLELRLAKTRVYAPFDGVIGEMFVKAGEFVVQGTDAARFISRDGFTVVVDVTEVEVQHMQQGQDVEAIVEVTGETVPVRVRTIDITEKRISDVAVYTVVFDVIGSTSGLRSGMTIDVQIPSGSPVDVFAVPWLAVMRKDLHEYVIVERGGDTMSVSVTVGESLDDGMVVVTGELYADDVVIFDTGAHEEE